MKLIILALTFVFLACSSAQKTEASLPPVNPEPIVERVPAPEEADTAPEPQPTPFPKKVVKKAKKHVKINSNGL